MPIDKWDVPSVCTGMCFNISSDVTEKGLVNYFVHYFGDMLDYAMFWHTTSKEDENHDVVMKVFKDLFKIPYTEINGTTIFHCSPVDFYISVNNFMKTEESIKYGYRNFSYLKGEETDESHGKLARWDGYPIGIYPKENPWDFKVARLHDESYYGDEDDY